MKHAYKAMRYMMTMTLSCVLAVFAGNFLDSLFHTSPWILLVFLAYAIIAGLYMLVKGLSDEHE